MSCSPFDLKDYFFQELPDTQSRQVEMHTRTCAVCREELERLELTGRALVSLGEEEIPQRLALVYPSAPEPSPFLRAWSAFWGSAARLGLASAAVVCLALLAFTLKLEQRISQLQRENAEVRRELVRAADWLDYSTREQLMFERSSYGEHRSYGEHQ
jgi:anti-sigma factor RsiW